MRVNEVEKSENYQVMAAEVERKLRDEMERWERQIVSGNFLFDRRPSVVIGDFCVRGKPDEGKSWTDQIYFSIFFISARQNFHVITAFTASYRSDIHHRLIVDQIWTKIPDSSPDSISDFNGSSSRFDLHL